ncbi:MAG: hypothetical protein UU16_C0057G0011 [Candidatus Woesebacteria bacterium GW2011_GWA2_40_7]|uniref:Uncharacterized protein n=3 Tax=Candidatus Woeseibacteriota TaxID=1752722 RepID=A0A0G0UUE8_9BACT|nr:MAG: hypothetical protein UT17_C0001G0137 [Candidatus Woesebacteria bacterium GW2011_GWB1_39_10]KKR71645.1 MAG: hypothetical protein UU16_C0057G0011 [Candidatus Woesebacteria bacterium GW2011_GWA2_40_7]KKR92323.1 MAG: hypothetical protein UU42_C0002G0137 [Candidatus Woesebacteria bacterium GW2011_GWA1_41_13b]
MAFLEEGRRFATEVFGNSGSVENLGKRVAAAIYHSVILHNKIDIKSDILIGVEKNLRKLLTDDEIKKIIDHYELAKENTNGKR